MQKLSTAIVRKYLSVFQRKTQFAYLRDTLFIIVVIIYFLNRFLIKPLTIHHTTFFASYLNDLICMPFWLPIVLFVTRKVRLRTHDEPPDIYELGFYLILWSF